MADAHFQEFQTRYKPIHSRFVKYCDSMAYGVMESKDLVQETVLVVLNRWDEIRKKDSLLAFMIGVASNQIKVQLRHLQRETRLELEKEALRNMESKTQNAELAYDIHLMHQAIDQLGEKERDCLVMFEISGFSVQEIALIQKDSEGAVKTRLSRARQRLKALLEDESSEKTGKLQAATLSSFLLLSIIFGGALEDTRPVKTIGHFLKISMKTIILVLVILSFSTGCTENHKTDGAAKGSVGSGLEDTCKRIDNYLKKLSTEKNFSGGLLIVKNGKKIFSKGYGWADKEKKIPFTSGTLASMGSITKAFTAAAIMKLVEQNKLSIEDNLGKFFPTVPSDKANITIHQLLTHFSGFHEFLKNDGGDFEKIETEAFLKRAFSEPLAFKPGEKAVYTNVGMSILAILVEKISGLGYEQFLRSNLFYPIGIKEIGYHYPESSKDTIAIGYQNGKSWGTHPQHFKQAGGGPYWNLKGNGGLEASLSDMALWVNAISDHTILSKLSVDRMFTPQVLEEGYNGQSSFGYGCNILKSRRNTKMIDNGGSNGIFFARLIRLPEEGLVFYMVTNESSINAMIVLPNVSQLYFNGKIEQDALMVQPKFRNPLSKKVYEIMNQPVSDLEAELSKQNITVEDDMVLLEVGQLLMQERKNEAALVLYKFYTKSFPQIVVAWNDLGDIYQTKGNKEKAITCYRQALKIRPENPRAKENLNKLLK